MNFEESNVASELLGVEELLERYTNPINKQMYMELFSIFINKEEMDIFTSMSEILSNEEQMDPGDITTIINTLTKRAAIAVLKNAYGIIVNEELEIRLLDLYNVLIKLKFLIEIDTERADKFKSIIDEREDDFVAYNAILEDLGVDLDFIYNYIEEIDYDFLDTYAKILTEQLESIEPDEDKMEDMLKLISVRDCLKAVLADNKSDLLNMSITRNSFLKESDILEVINLEEFNISNLAFELISGYKLIRSDESVSEFFKNYTENLSFKDLTEEESYFVSFKDLDSKYKIELAKRMSNE